MSSLLTSLVGPVSNLLDKFVEDKDQKNKLAHDLATLATRHAHDLAKGQIAANAEQAKHPSIFVETPMKLSRNKLDISPKLL